MNIFKFLGVLSPLHINVFTATRKKEHVGDDQFGNIYYRGGQHQGSKRERRWVIYKGAPDASMVPAEWHGWLHYQTDIIPEEHGRSFRRSWQKPHQRNMTGTSQAYHPSKCLDEGTRAKATGDYEAWKPAE